MREIEIPTFEVGEKVILHVRPVEDSPCPLCGHGFMPDITPHDEEVTILGTASGIWFCSKCKGIFETNPDGWWRIQKSNGIFGAPWPLLEKLKKVSDGD